MGAIWQLFLKAFSRSKIYVDVIFTEFAPNGPIVNKSALFQVKAWPLKVDYPKAMLTYRQWGP